MYECLDLFSEPTGAWFRHAFAQGETAAQRQAWPVIAKGDDALVIAPTGSGKTLSAFLYAIDRLMNRAPEAGEAGGSRSRKPAKGVKVLYISPLKALGVDVARNLETPLAGIAAQCKAMGLNPPSIRVATRSGDTTAQERRAIASHPPDILVTTPESLYLILTSKARRILSTVRTVIVDEIHAIAGTKRGAHLALSLERLDMLTAEPAQRIGLSATVRPAEAAARFLGGARAVTIVDVQSRPAMELKVVEPVEQMPESAAPANRSCGGAGSGKPSGLPSISGVTPAMMRLAERQGTVTASPGPAHGPLRARADVEAGETTSAPGNAISADERAGSVWPAVERSILNEVLSHHTTLVFVNSRGLAERLTARLNDLYAAMPGHGDADEPRPDEPYTGQRHFHPMAGPSTNLIHPHAPEDTIAMTHHGSVSKDRRKRIEEDLKHGRLRCVVATSSLELGIDMGSVDLVIQVSPPLSVSSGLQRVGRADHQVGGVSHALFYPLTREQIIGAAATVECMQTGDIEPLSIPRCPLDVLAQHTVAAAAMEDLNPDDWYQTVRRAAPFADLDRSVFDSVLGMLTGAYDSEAFTAFRPSLMWNHEEHLISARPGAQRLAVTSGGTIPDRGQYTVVLPEQEAGKGPRRVGELDEEMVYESRIGDIITLGTSTWQIQDITHDRVVVVPAPGRTARLPFWHGEGFGRDAGFGEMQGRFVRDMVNDLHDGDCTVASVGVAPFDYPASSDCAASSDGMTSSSDAAAFDDGTTDRLRADGLDGNAISNLAQLLHEQRIATGAVPTDRTLVVERCPDEEGDWRIVLHSPYGKRVHEPWAMIVGNRIKQRYGYDGQVYACDDGIILLLPQSDGHIPAAELFTVDPDDIQRLVAEQVGESVLFTARFRECAARSLYLPRTDPGKRVPLWQQRLRGVQLLNAARTQRNFPLLLETTRECLQDVYDLPALRRLMTRLSNGEIDLVDVETQAPSPFAETIMFGYVGQVMYQYDQPHAERSAALLSLDFDALERLLGTADMTAVLDPDVIHDVERELAGRTFWNELDERDVAGRVARYAKTHGPFTVDMMMVELHLDAERAVRELDGLKARGEVLTGLFMTNPGRGNGSRSTVDDAQPGEGAESYGGMGKPVGGMGPDVEMADDHRPVQYLHRDVFRRIRARSLNKAREAIKPVAPAVYQALLLDRQGVGPVGGERYDGVDGLMRVIEQLEGVSLPLPVWEGVVFPARVRGYQPAILDELLASGDVVWTGEKTAGTKAKEPGRIAFHPADSELLINTAAADATGHPSDGAPDDTMTGDTAPDDDAGQALESVRTLPDAILHVLAAGGAFRAERLAELVRAAWRPDTEPVDLETGEIRPPAWSNSQFEDALWSLVWQGAVTNSSLTPVRAMASAVSSHATRSVSVGRTRRRARVAVQVPVLMQGLWSAVPTVTATAEQRSLARIEVLLDRYGIIAPPLIDAEDVPGGFSTLYPVLRRMEEHGTLVRGMFVQGFGAAQFARRDTVDQLRHAGEGHSRSCVAIEVMDPANLTGAAVTWPQYGGQASKPLRRAGGMVVLDHGNPVVYAAVKGHHLTTFTDDGDTLRRAFAELAYALQRRPSGSVAFADLNGEPLTARTEAARILHAAGFTPCPQGMKLYR